MLEKIIAEMPMSFIAGYWRAIVKKQNKKYRVRLVVDDFVEATSPFNAKEYLWDMVRDGFYGMRSYQIEHYMSARRRKDLEEA